MEFGAACFWQAQFEFTISLRSPRDDEFDDDNSLKLESKFYNLKFDPTVECGLIRTWHSTLTRVQVVIRQRTYIPLAAAFRNAIGSKTNQNSAKFSFLLLSGFTHPTAQLLPGGNSQLGAGFFL